MAAGVFYVLSAAPGYTWAHFGADGGDFLAAAVTNGVPHPPGYPLYTLLLQAWLALGTWVLPGATPARLGNLFSAFWAALAVGCTVPVLVRLRLPLRVTQARAWVMFVALAWTVSPLLWDQATITEVYALHAWLVVMLLGIALGDLGRWEAWRPWGLGLVLGLGMAHHITVLLLLPALVYGLWRVDARARRPSFWLRVLLATVPGLALYLRIPWAAAMDPPSPVNWGWAVTWDRFWWLISGAAYRDYLFAVTSPWSLARLGRWAQILSGQYTPVGFAILLLGLYRLDRDVPWVRNLILLWVLPLSIYMVTYNTVDSEVYLLPLVWWMALLLAEGLEELRRWCGDRLPARWCAMRTWAVVGLIGLAAITGVRWPDHALTQERAAEQYLDAVKEVLEPDSIVFSTSDPETFALWYGAWARGDLLEQVPGAVLLNTSLFQFDWYRELMVAVYPEVAGIRSGSVGGLVAANVGIRPIYFAEPTDLVPVEQLERTGPLWRYRP